MIKRECLNLFQEELEDTKGIIRIRKSEKQTIQWPKEKVQKDKQRSAKHTHKRSRNKNN